MGRIARIVVIDTPHHITQRGNHQQDIFIDDQDRIKYLSWIQEYSAKHGLSILSYCLMNNHVHFIAIPRKHDSFSKVFGIAHTRYSQYFNKKTGLSGHLWQGRFYSCVLDELHTMAAARYVERNPVRAGLVKKPWEWNWSSSPQYVNNLSDKNSIIKLYDILKLINTSPEQWKKFINMDDDKNEIEAIKKHTEAGRPLGNKNFIERLEEKFNKKLSIVFQGRPKKGQTPFSPT